MLPRTLEPEVMDTSQEAIDYDAMDHREVNRAFVDDLLAAAARTEGGVRFYDKGNPHVLDVGTGTAQIPIELCRRSAICHVTGVDLAGEMLKLGRQNIERAGLMSRVQVERADAKDLKCADGTYDVVMSNSIVHHIPKPLKVLAQMVRLLRPGGLLFVRDLLRPPDAETVEHFVQNYAGEENPHQQKMFRDSLHAALTLEEIRGLLSELNVPPIWAKQTSDRHWTISGHTDR
ncbi:MAG: class I SAM-dependent methyltransferase [Planctomycetaceae bacterium]|jgi:ubiquinone/menaquinone biosynthesis C-methylase UbiE|nr:class I SAM-dependent methyltransferase [Planctomycetaceae bacterium]MBT6154710.1 class I SAM-dependent methyltransferase [Planctomycetaceae bacterium]MBT6485890.1 class I SAM-dependent methyltransferase [Planctomycetaceae bacterium]MBT6493462.1 class I SAM-dependent methyltransferase [Planctomycetaceae bacterium]